MKTITYYSQNAPAGQEWMAMALLPNGQRWLVTSSAGSEAEAVEKITALYQSEINKHKPAYVQMIGRTTRPLQNNNTMVEGWLNGPAKSGRGSHFVGKVWLIHSTTREKIRVDKNEVEKYLNEGWEKGGPRSK